MLLSSLWSVALSRSGPYWISGSRREVSRGFEGAKADDVGRLNSGASVETSPKMCLGLLGYGKVVLLNGSLSESPTIDWRIKPAQK